MKHPGLFFVRMLCLLQVVCQCLHGETSRRAEEVTKQSLHDGIRDYYRYWKDKYLIPSTRFPGDFKVDYDGKGTTVSEAIGYGMLITALMSDEDPDSKKYFDGLDRFRKHFPSCINPSFMCWRISPSEKPRKDDSATDGDFDMAYALLLADQRWGGGSYLAEAKTLITNFETTLVRSDGSLRLGDWNDEFGQTRPSDFMPAHFRAFASATGSPVWAKVENRCYAILAELRQGAASRTGLVPDFALCRKGRWVPADPGFLEGPHDGDYDYNACRVPWRLGWGALATGDECAKQHLGPLMAWIKAKIAKPGNFRAGYHLDGRPVRNSDFHPACYISPSGVAALALGDVMWRDEVFECSRKLREDYYSDSVNLLCLIVMSGDPPARTREVRVEKPLYLE